MAFPSSPSVGQKYNEYEWNGEYWSKIFSQDIVEEYQSTSAGNTWRNTGINVNGGQGGKLILISISTHGDYGDVTWSSFGYVRCGYNGDNATYYNQWTTGSTYANPSIRVVSGILEVSVAPSTGYGVSMYLKANK